MKLPERILILSRNIKSTIGFSLIFVFLGLGSCTVKKAFHIFLEEFPGTAQNQDMFNSTKISVNIKCSADGSLTQKLSLPERGFTLSHSPYFFLPTFLRFDFPTFEKGYNLKYDLEIAYSYSDAVPVYLRNRILLI